MPHVFSCQIFSRLIGVSAIFMKRTGSPLRKSRRLSSIYEMGLKNPEKDDENERKTLNDGVTVLAKVDQSQFDYKEYRAIQLSNNLKVLLVCDSKPGESLDDEESDEDKESSETESDGEESTDSEKDEMEPRMEHQSDEEEHLKKDKTKSQKMSAAALCVGTGSFCDPHEFPGMAHFLEHMVFMGSKKYPEENAFDDFICKHGGNDNAYTDCERTVFYFDIQKRYFREALDRWAQFFIEPLLNADSVDRELKAVDSEFQMSLPSDTARLQQLLGNFAKAGHPMGKFMWGNMDSLKVRPSKENLNPYDKLHEFCHQMYSSHYMTLVVQSKESLDTLQEMVVDIFSNVPHNNLPQPDFKSADMQRPFDTNEFHKLYKVVPVKNVNQLEITWQLPCLLDKYRVKPLHYLGWLIGHEGKGSLLAYLRKKYWALSLTSGNDGLGFEHNSTWAVFSITVTLTESGLQHYDEVLQAVFQYLEMLRQVGPQSKIYEEIQTIETNDFRWKEQCDPSDNVQDLVENMQLYPPELYLTGDNLMFEFNSELISDIQEMLKPRLANIMLLSKSFESTCDKKEPWFQTKYSVEDINKVWLNNWDKVQPISDFHIPDPNKYIATDFSIKSKNIHLSDKKKEPPSVLYSNQFCKLFYKSDDVFHIPKGYIYFHLISPVVRQSTKMVVLFDIFKKILEQNLSETAYAADVAQLSYSFKLLPTGLQISLNGFNHKLHLLLETIVEHLVSFDSTEELFLVVKEQLAKTYYNVSIKSSNLERDVRRGVLYEDRKWTLADLRCVVETVNKEDLMKFVQLFRERLFAEIYVHGNFTGQEACDMMLYMCGKLGLKKPSNDHPQTCVHTLPDGQTTCRLSSFNKEDANSVITNYYQHGPGSIHKSVLNDLLLFRMEEPCFNFLRTKEQLGYSVYCSNLENAGILGMSVTVQFQCNKFSVDHVEEKIEEFLEKIFANILVDMSEDDFKKQVEALVVLKRLEDTHMSEESNRNWKEIIDQTYVFHRLDCEVAELQKLNLAEFRDWFKNLVGMNGCSAKKMSCQVIGHTEAIGDTVDSTTNTSDCKLTFLNVKEKKDMHIIQDINLFKEKLQTFPASKITQ